VGVELTSFTPECSLVDGGYRCSANYTARCAISGQPLVDRCD
jgi:hypothetical protein